MILPISVYGTTVLRKKAVDITPDYPELKQLIQNMFDTMEKADGVGLAAPQVNHAIRLFVVNGAKFADDYVNEPELRNFRKVFINPKIVEFSGAEASFSEGCLSIPGLYEDVIRKTQIEIEYLDENFVAQKEHLIGVSARIVMHEYDHLDGILFVDRISPIKKRMIKGKLDAILNEKTHRNYKMRFASKKMSV